MLNNPKLKMDEILEWGEIKPASPAEILVRLPDPGVNICVLKLHDHRQS